MGMLKPSLGHMEKIQVKQEIMPIWWLIWSDLMAHKIKQYLSGITEVTKPPLLNNLSYRLQYILKN